MSNDKYNLSLSFLGFSLKAISAFILGWMAANNLQVDAFAIWAIFFSISMVLSAGDFGVGQYILTYMASSEDGSKFFFDYFFNGMSALVALSFPIFLVGLIAVEATGLERAFGVLLCSLVAMRVPMIAYGAFMQVKDRIHEKRLLDSVPYVLSIPILYVMYQNNLGVYLQLLVVNTLLTLGSIAVMFRCRSLGVPKYQWSGLLSVKLTLRKASPFFLNNASGIVIYGGFISIFSFYLSTYQLAVLAIYHSVVLSLGYQIYDVIFRNYQLRINESNVFNNLSRFLVLSSFLVFIMVNRLGVKFLEFFYSKYNFEQSDLNLFLLFSCLEFGYLLVSTQVQMDVGGSKILSRCSVIKLVSFFVMALSILYIDVVNIFIICLCLITFSLLNLMNLIFTKKLA